MSLKRIDENPTISDIVYLEFKTTDDDGNAADPYRVDQVIVYFSERNFFENNVYKIPNDVGGVDNDLYPNTFHRAVPIKVVGNQESPAWLSTDVNNASIVHDEYDSEGAAQEGVFHFEWFPQFAREGNYFVCYTWTTDTFNKISNSYHFFLNGDTQQTTSIPSHFTNPYKYETLLERYLPEMYKTRLGGGDLTPDVLSRFNSAVAQSFTFLENLANQIIDLNDANVVKDNFLPYLANLFNLKLRTQDSTLWRRQIKNAIPLYKKKGTLGGLIQALEQADIVFKKLTHLWQIVSPNTWQEAFFITSNLESEFELEKTALVDVPLDHNNFELYLRPAGENEYTQLSLDYVEFTSTTMTWVGDNLSVDPISLHEGDILRVIYKIKEPDDQSIEDYIRSLSLSDLRDERTFTYPPKNWNVRVIEEDDPLFDVIIPTRHPYFDPVVWGKIRTEFPYSENSYNMDEYNGSKRNSTDPCDIGRDFIDVCTACRSSKYTVDVEIENLSNDRLIEAEKIIEEYTPFHAVLHSINYTGSFSDFILPPVEEVECLMTIKINSVVLSGQDRFTRTIHDGNFDPVALRRDALAEANSVATGSNGIGHNEALLIYSAEVNFKEVDVYGENILEITTGSNAGIYSLNNLQRHYADIEHISGGTSNYWTFPLDSSEFKFNISNIIYQGTVTSVTRDDLYIFSDENESFRLSDVDAGWTITITSGIYAGDYEISETYPNDSLKILNWPTTSSVIGLSYEVKNLSNDVIFSGTSGKVTVRNRGLVLASANWVDSFNLKPGNYISLNNYSNQYKIVEIVSEDSFYIDEYTGSTTGIQTGTLLKRVTTRATGTFGLRGMKLTTSTNYEVSLEIIDGENNVVANPVEDNSFKENFLILIDSNYYKVSKWDGFDIYLEGTSVPLEWGIPISTTTSTTGIIYTILQYVKTSPVVVYESASDTEGYSFERLDRRNREVIQITTQTISPFMALGSFGAGGPTDAIGQTEDISVSIEWR